MANQNWSPYSFAGTTVDGSGNILMEFPGPGWPYEPGGTDPVEAMVTGVGSSDVRAQPRSVTAEAQIILKAHDETDVATMMGVFNERAGLVYLRAKDGQASPVTWRVACRVVGPPRAWLGSRDHFSVTLRVPLPLWEEDTLQTDTKSNQTASPIAMGTAGVLTNAGTRDADAKITLTADVAKSENSHLADWPYSFESIWVNRSPNPLTDEPVYLGDQSGAAARIVTDSAASGAVVRRTTNATTLTADPGAAGTTIAVTSAAAFNANGGMAIIRWVTGATFGTMECVYYTGVSGLNLTGCVRGIGGTTAQAHPIASAIAACGTMANGDDVAVWLDHARQDVRYLVAWNSAASDIVINVTAPAAIALTLTAAMTATVPAVGNTIRFVEGNGTLADQGFLLCQNEVFHFSVKSGQDGVVIDGRALWGTTAAAHATSALVYANPHRVTVGFGWAKAPAALAPIASRPCIDLPASSNLVQRWGDQASDANTRYVDTVYPGRPKQWSRGFDRDGNTVSPLISFDSLPSGVPSAQFKDDVPGDGSDPANFIEIAIPQGIGVTASDIINDWTPAAEILNLELFTRDAGGTLKLQDQLQQAAAAAARANATLPATAYAIKLKGRYSIVTGYRAVRGDSAVTITNATALGNGTIPDGCGGVRFTIPACRPTSFSLKAKLVSAGTQAIGVWILDSGGTLGSPTVNNTTIGGGSRGYVGSFTVTSTSEAGFTVSLPRSMIPDGGSFWIIMGKVGAIGPNVILTGDVANTGVGGGIGSSAIWSSVVTGASWVTNLTRLQVPHLYVNTGYDNQGNAPIVAADNPIVVAATSARTGTTASFDKTIITLEPLQTVYVHRLTGPVTNGAAGAMLHMQCVVANATNGDSLTVDKWMRATATLVIDAKAKTVNYVEDGISYPLLSVLDAAPQLRLSPGDNTVTVTDASLIAPGQMDAAIEHRGARV